MLADQWDGKRLNAPNGIVVSKSGHVYFTDPAFGDQQDTRELDFYGVYHIPPKGQLSLIAKPAGRPNGIALSPNGRMLYVANSDEAQHPRLRRGSRRRSLRRARDRGPQWTASRTASAPVKDGKLYVAAKGIEVYQPGRQSWG